MRAMPPTIAAIFSASDSFLLRNVTCPMFCATTLFDNGRDVAGVFIFNLFLFLFLTPCFFQVPSLFLPPKIHSVSPTVSHSFPRQARDFLLRNVTCPMLCAPTLFDNGRDVAGVFIFILFLFLFLTPCFFQIPSLFLPPKIHSVSPTVSHSFPKAGS
jgi:hypothetical protein